MNHTLPLWCAALTILLVGTAVVTDLRWRRIPNYLTFSAFGLALVVRIVFQGWAGLGLALLGAVLAPVLLLLLHAGKGIGMGDLKLSAALGAIFGPLLAVVTIFVSAIAGGILAIVWMLRPGGLLAQLLRTITIGLPFLKKREGESAPDAPSSPATETIPYGLAIGAGSLITLAVSWWTGHENWFLSFVGVAGKL